MCEPGSSHEAVSINLAMRVFFSNLGCKLNQAEVDAHARRFVAAGHSLAPSLEEAELHVINSCTVTHRAARDSRKTARRAHRLGTGIRTVLTGCYVSAEPDEAARLAGVDLVVTNDRKHRLLELVHAAFPEVLPDGRAELEDVPVHYAPLEYGRARALVKVEDGCNMRCAFCIIPSTRGRQRSRPLEEVVAEVKALVSVGYREVVITGVQISEYDDEGRRLYDLVAALLERTDVPRLRLTSIAPWKFDHRLLELWTDRRLARHVHMSLQSGSSATLRRMRRPYSACDFEALAESLRSAIPGLALTTDIIVGFPGETELEFSESLAFVEKVAFAKPHVFSYSQRSGTHAATLPNPVAPAEIKRRTAEMTAVAKAADRSFRRRFLGETFDVLWEERKVRGWSGLTDNYIRVNVQEDETPLDLGGNALAGALHPARLLALDRQGVRARLVVSNSGELAEIPQPLQVSL